jgi:arylsulfatase A-like enzyme
MGMDFLPTALELAGVDPPTERKLDGTSMKSLLLDGAEFPDRTLFFGYEPKLGTAMRDGDWKMIVKGEKRELYNLAEDPGERTNLIEKHSSRAAEMAAQIAGWKGQTPRGS